MREITRDQHDQYTEFACELGEPTAHRMALVFLDRETAVAMRADFYSRLTDEVLSERIGEVDQTLARLDRLDSWTAAETELHAKESDRLAALLAEQGCRKPSIWSRVLVDSGRMLFAGVLLNGELNVYRSVLVADGDPMFAPVAKELAAGGWALEHEHEADDAEWYFGRIRCQTYQRAAK
ncbi:hypothetical protein [Amycolatopsis orientalis]|uniref:hypothetical protein n=1 Tax=Amycolatopsis orientalis TaxID=31958 RepID=UPI0003A172B9|nr:hypothetical protein [Amycolatopsis orientalis]